MTKFQTYIGGTPREFNAVDVYEFDKKFTDWYNNIYLMVCSSATDFAELFEAPITALLASKGVEVKFSDEARSKTDKKEIDGVVQGYFYRNKERGDITFSLKKLIVVSDNIEEIHTDNLDELQKKLFS